MLGYIKWNANNFKVYASLVSIFSQEDPPELAGWDLEPELELELSPERVISRFNFYHNLKNLRYDVWFRHYGLLIISSTIV